MRYYFNNSRFAFISSLGGQYDKFEPSIDLGLQTTASHERRNAESVMPMFSELNPSVFVYGPTGDQFGLRFNGNVLRQVIDILFKSNQINASDRSDIENEIKSFENSLSRREKISQTLNKGQAEAFEMITSPYIDGIFDHILDNTLVISIFDVAMCDIPVCDSNSFELLIGNRMRSRGIKDKFDEQVSDLKTRKEIYQCIWEIWKIYSDSVNLSDTFLKTGATLPDLKSQREHIVRTVFRTVSSKLKPGQKNIEEILSASEKLLEYKFLDKNIILEIQKPAKIEHQQNTGFITQNAFLYELHKERESRRSSTQSIENHQTDTKTKMEFN